MILVDCNGYECSDSKVKVSAFEGNPEFRYTKVVGMRIDTDNHNTFVRISEMTAKERALYLLGYDVADGEATGKREDIGREDIAISLRLGGDPLYQGFTVMIAAGNYGPDILLQNTIRKWLAFFPGLRDLTEEEDITAKRKAPLLVYKEPSAVRPARVQIELCSATAIDAEYWLRPTQLKLFAEHISRAINEYDDLYDEFTKKSVFIFTDTPPDVTSDTENEEEELDDAGVEAPPPRKKKRKKVIVDDDD